MPATEHALTDADTLTRADANYYEAWRLSAATSTDGVAIERDGVLIVDFGVPIIWVNIIFVTRPLAEPARALSNAIAHFDSRGVPFLGRVREGVDAGAEAAFEKLGLPYADTVPGMVLSPIESGTTAGVAVRQVAGAADFRTWVDIIGESFDIGSPHRESMLTPRFLDVPDAHFYVGYVDGEAAGASALVMSHHVAGVHFVGTRASFRRRGVGEAMTRHAMGDGAAAGCPFAALQASEMGRPVYERIGFRTVTGYKTFVRPPSS